MEGNERLDSTHKTLIIQGSLESSALLTTLNDGLISSGGLSSSKNRKFNTFEH